MQIKGVLFDKDGTLLDYWRTWIPINREIALMAAGGDGALANELLALGGHDPTTDAITPGSVLAAGSHDEIAEAFAAHLGARTPPRLASRIEMIFRDGGAKHAVLVERACETIDDLAAMGLVMGIATNDSEGGLRASLARPPGFLERFAFLAGCDSGFGAKPDPGMALAFCSATGLEPAAIAIVGDSTHDMEMGRRARAGLNIGLLGGTSTAGDLAHAAHVVLGSLGELPPYLRMIR
ncbi:MAG: HAD family hydrolase [Hyphomicrobiaceae bacterium]